MANSAFNIKRPWLILSLFLIGWWIIPTILKSFSHLSFQEFQAPIWNTTAKLKDLQHFWSFRNHSKLSLIQANRDLARINASYTLSLTENDALKEELSRIEEILELPQIANYQYLFARVTRRELATWSHQMIIQKGFKEGIIEGAAVINKLGVIGRVKTVNTHSSIVELISSPKFRVAARIAGDSRPITFQGMTNAPFSNPIGLVYNVPTDICCSNANPTEIVSSRLGGVFPDGLPIGIITHLEPGTEGLFQRANVQLNTGLHSVQEVAVLIPINKNYDS